MEPRAPHPVDAAGTTRRGPSGTHRLGVALVGLGRWGPNLARVLAADPRVELRAVADRDPEALARWLPPAFQSPHRTRVAEEAITFPGVDLAVLATGPSGHEQLGLLALDEGRHLFVEKPLALDAAVGGRLVDAAGRRARHLFVGHVLLHHPAVEQVRACIDDGSIGAVQHIQGERCGWDPAPPERSAWWALAPHELSLAVRTLDLQRGELRVLPLRLDPEGRDRAVALWLRDTRGPSVHAVLALDEPERLRRWTVAGSRGWLRFDDDRRTPALRLWTAGGGRPRVLPVPATEPLAREMDHVVTSIISGPPAPAESLFQRRVLTLLDAGAHSLRAGGRPTPWEFA